MEIPDSDMEVCLRVLQRVADSHGLIRGNERFHALISKVYREGKRFEPSRTRREQQTADRSVRADTGMVARQSGPASEAALPAVRQFRRLNKPESCYICKAKYSDVHFFYHLLCPTCAAYNFEMRGLSADLTGRSALITGGRVKIGFQTALRMLQDGARVIVTTRFPQAAAARFEAEDDADSWRERLTIYGLDLRSIPAVEELAQRLLDSEPHLDILIHNAAQTVRRPSGFYRELMAAERAGLPLPPATDLALASIEADARPAALPAAAAVAAVIGTDVLPIDNPADREELADSRVTNSWRLRLHEVTAPELVEVQLVNAISPFLLTGLLKPLMLRSPFARRFVVNVSAVEGQFQRHKTVYHPHTNMAKAALNMMTRTSADDYAQDRIYMNSVDTGWVTDENPSVRRERNQEELGFYPPLDAVDGMARIYHPVAYGINRAEEPLFGRFLKDYHPCPW